MQAESRMVGTGAVPVWVDKGLGDVSVPGP